MTNADFDDDAQLDLTAARLRAGVRTHAMMVEALIARRALRAPLPDMAIDRELERCLGMVTTAMERAALRQRAHAARVATVALRDALHDIVLERLAEVWQTAPESALEPGEILPKDARGALQISAPLADKRYGAPRTRFGNMPTLEQIRHFDPPPVVQQPTPQSPRAPLGHVPATMRLQLPPTPAPPAPPDPRVTAVSEARRRKIMMAVREFERMSDLRPTDAQISNVIRSLDDLPPSKHVGDGEFTGKTKIYFANQLAEALTGRPVATIVHQAEHHRYSRHRQHQPAHGDRGMYFGATEPPGPTELMTSLGGRSALVHALVELGPVEAARLALAAFEQGGSAAQIAMCRHVAAMHPAEVPPHVKTTLAVHEAMGHLAVALRGDDGRYRSEDAGIQLESVTTTANGGQAKGQVETWNSSAEMTWLNRGDPTSDRRNEAYSPDLIPSTYGLLHCARGGWPGSPAPGECGEPRLAQSQRDGAAAGDACANGTAHGEGKRAG